ncbi:hypothetical protein TIFTF001_023090 [Ficus carica]|uniref:Uncharacterized protein n=1 Tax=Ficus carica TaxID=3494 RepID=A0AA88AL74_FICCA|nr:hypothetical protein TIFTF001_023090 [Ficus carica]
MSAAMTKEESSAINQHPRHNPTRVRATTARTVTTVAVANNVSPLRHAKKREPSTVGHTNSTRWGRRLSRSGQNPLPTGDSFHPRLRRDPRNLRRDPLTASVMDLTSQWEISISGADRSPMGERPSASSMLSLLVKSDR